MKDFVALLMLSKFENVSSYIQSGNIVLKSTIPLQMQCRRQLQSIMVFRQRFLA
ncbi:DUF1697 domain-containing protein [Psychrosphaera sp. G1-22]|uniref:DUF1697 domain-containing protein n=1 Tax=Psychrosphaera algicola TaxID=3023714 RepID=A0ABT5FHZ8_9GAMM|nr:DUF1697 domain-containing protein [Psychrosphaera sp. G1-22]MDC2890818.1 DUF1697 domain-containing protein [Psychrosphaera sp. G1-22]